MKKIILIGICMSLALQSCSSSKTYESDIFPTGDFLPVNPEYFGKPEAQRILEGALPK